MLGYLRTKLGIRRIFGIPFISSLRFRFFAQPVLRAFPLTFYNQIGQQCVVPMGRCSVMLFFCVVQFYLWWEDFSSSLCTIFFYQYFMRGFLSKKKKLLINLIYNCKSRMDKRPMCYYGCGRMRIFMLKTQKNNCRWFYHCTLYHVSIFNYNMKAY